MKWDYKNVTTGVVSELFSIFLSPHLPSVQISASVACSETPPICSSLNGITKEKMYLTVAKQLTVHK
jgi:hypothetical protein